MWAANTNERHGAATTFDGDVTLSGLLSRNLAALPVLSDDHHINVASYDEMQTTHQPLQFRIGSLMAQLACMYTDWLNANAQHGMCHQKVLATKSVLAETNAETSVAAESKHGRHRQGAWDT